MENNTDKIKFPIGAIFMILCAIWSIWERIIRYGYLYLDFWTIIEVLSYATIAVMAIMKKRGLPILVPFAVLTLFVLIRFSAWRIPYLAALVLVLLLSLDDMKIGNLSNYRSIFAKAFIASISLDFIIMVVLGISNETGADWLAISIVIVRSIAILLVGLWINNPYKKIKEIKQKDNTLIKDKYYVSLGKHICLLIFTFGIWQMIWIYKTTQFTNCTKGEDERNPATKLLLYLFIPFYSIYWTYKSAQRIDMIAKDGGIGSDLGTVCLILAIFIGIVPPILMQDKINEIIKKNSLSSVNEDVVL